jgi:hypothetical protein
MDRQTVIAALVFALFASTFGAAQEPAAAEVRLERPLYEHEPYDRLTLNDKERTVLHLVPLSADERKNAASHKPTDQLRIRLFDDPDKPYDVAWSDVAELRYFEQLIFDEAIAQTQAGKFAAAFDTFLYLRREHPKLPGLEEAEQALLVAEAKAALAANRPEDAMVRLVRLQQRNDRHAELADLAATATERLLETYLKSARPAAARPLVLRFAAKFAKHPAHSKLQQQLSVAADARLKAAQQAIADARFTDAQRESEAAAMLSGDPSAAIELYRRAVESHPIAVVGVVETVSADGRHGIQGAETWAHRRTARLDQLPTLEPIVTAAPPLTVTYGGAARWIADDRDPLSFRLQLSGSYGSATAADTAAALLAVGRPAGLELTVVDPRVLELHLAQPHPRFEAHLAVVTGEAAPFGTAGRAPYPIVERAEDFVRRSRPAAAPAVGPAEILERRYLDEDAALTALHNGEIDAVDRLAPWQVAAVGSRRELKLTRYAAASVHLLLFNGERALLRRPEFRRAIQYAIDRESILRNHLRPASDDLGSRVVDGLFPIGRSTDDPLGYAYDLTGPTNAYDPQRAYLLTALARSVEADGGLGTTARPLVLRHPSTATAARACRRIATNLAAVGIVVELQAAPPDRAPASAAEADLVYITVQSLEPLVDAPRLLGPGGLANLPSLSLEVALHRLSQAETIAAARAILFDVQRLLHDEALVVPLWQLTEYAATRSRLTLAPVGRAPTGTYQFVDEWRLEPRYNEPLP